MLSRLATYLNELPDWGLAFSDDLSSVFVRKNTLARRSGP